MKIERETKNVDNTLPLNMFWQGSDSTQHSLKPSYYVSYLTVSPSASPTGTTFIWNNLPHHLVPEKLKALFIGINKRETKGGGGGSPLPCAGPLRQGQTCRACHEPAGWAL